MTITEQLEDRGIRFHDAFPPADHEAMEPGEKGKVRFRHRERFSPEVAERKQRHRHVRQFVEDLDGLGDDLAERLWPTITKRLDQLAFVGVRNGKGCRHLGERHATIEIGIDVEGEDLIQKPVEFVLIVDELLEQEPSIPLDEHISEIEDHALDRHNRRLGRTISVSRPRFRSGVPMKNNLGLFVTKRALLMPSMEAIVDVTSGQRQTYLELNGRCNRVANGMNDGGLKIGDRVATLLMNGPEFVETFFGAAKAGGVIVALNWRLVADELSFILTDAGATTLVFGTAFNDVVNELHSRGTDGTQVTNWVHVGEAADRPEFAIGYEDVLARASADEPDVTACDDDLLFIMYTSGTTGLPKGVMHTHNTALWSVITGNTTADTRYGDRYLICLPLFHVGALNPLLSIIHKGGTGVIMADFDPVKIWEVYGEEKISVTLAVPAMLNFMLLTYDKENHDISSLRWVMSGAAPVPISLIETYAGMGIEIHQVYGLTETCGPGCLISPDDAIAHAGSTGKAFFHTDVRVVNDDGQDCGADEPGEIWIRGPHVMTGYWNRPEATAETFVDGWFKTGDVATMDSDGFVYIQDRIKDMIISGGENVYPAEIENVLAGMEGVTEAAVIGITSEKWGESPLAIVVKSDESITAEDVIAYCDGKLARFKTPKGVEFTDVIPRNPTGKVLKRVLREQYEIAAPE